MGAKYIHKMNLIFFTSVKDESKLEKLRKNQKK